ncbi:MAG TPA: 7-cyano-7-deazaguanine synthase QueC [Gammaproteobacteria bacterium]|nr:7-cyano-7-deazaguanine synthase QueC [Gammaproteobacteria bacterium]
MGSVAVSQQSAKAVVLLSGGLDSATVLAIAHQHGHDCYALSVRYGQRHAAELRAAQRIARGTGVVEHRIFPLELSAFGGSALTDPRLKVPKRPADGIPVTYVPARNTVFLSIALSWAEVLGARNIFIGVNAVDYSGYPDCRPEYLAAFERLANLATKAGVEGDRFHIHAPLINLTKGEIIRCGLALGVDYAVTVSCYTADEQGRACGDCDACRFRNKGFAEADIPDPTIYR